jgi:uncharacterized protein YecT (DUF1311 family)
MTSVRIIAAGLALVVAPGSTAWAQDAQCPRGSSNDACDQWAFEQADKELALLVERKLSELDRRSTLQERTERAKSSLQEAQREWVRFRDAECRGRAAANMISARTPQGLTSACLSALTRRRIEEIRKY